MDENEPVIIMNPNCYTYENDEPEDLDKIIEDSQYKVLENGYLDFEAQQEANSIIQKQICVANRDIVQKARIDSLKEKGIYKSSKEQR